MSKVYVKKGKISLNIVYISDLKRSLRLPFKFNFIRILQDFFRNMVGNLYKGSKLESSQGSLWKMQSKKGNKRLLH